MEALIVDPVRHNELLRSTSLTGTPRELVNRVQRIVGGWYYRAMSFEYFDGDTHVATDSLWLYSGADMHEPLHYFAVSRNSIEFPFVGVGVIAGLDLKNLDLTAVHGSLDYWSARIRAISSEQAERLRLLTLRIPRT